ncbi:MAG: hypothetical protein JWN37_413 [Candidatus Nomurabacteria bacterium]|nr:hypothetical protein [Candidatus Nomurabacteria bacterium]
MMDRFGIVDKGGWSDGEGCLSNRDPEAHQLIEVGQCRFEKLVDNVPKEEWIALDAFIHECGFPLASTKVLITPADLKGRLYIRCGEKQICLITGKWRYA